FARTARSSNRGNGSLRVARSDASVDAPGDRLGARWGTRMGATPAEGDLLLGRYTLGPLVGLGGTAKVFRAWDQEGGGTVAVKVFPPGSASPTRDGRREREVLTGVRHAGLIEIRDSGVDDEGFPFVVMDFIEGESLAARLRRG